jgi:hypothetical protein
LGAGPARAGSALGRLSEAVGPRAERLARELLKPAGGFLPGTDERVTGTIDALWRELGRDGFVSRYSTAETDDGLSADEGQFLACSFWLVSALALNGRVGEALTLFDRLLGLANDLGFLAEEYDVKRKRQVGNFPQAFSHLTLIGAANSISTAETARSSVARNGDRALVRSLTARKGLLLDLVELGLVDRAFVEELLRVCDL